jgi:hypothetical protein
MSTEYASCPEHQTQPFPPRNTAHNEENDAHNNRLQFNSSSGDSFDSLFASRIIASRDSKKPSSCQWQFEGQENPKTYFVKRRSIPLDKG